MKKSILTLSVLLLFAIGSAASDETEKSSSQQTEQTTDNRKQENPKKSKKDEIREIGYNDGVTFGRSDGGDALRGYTNGANA